jgi:hypothetical protein
MSFTQYGHKYSKITEFPYICSPVKSQTMKYLVRAIKYFFYFAIVTTALVAVLVFIGAVEGNIDAIFEGGYAALWKMAIFFAAVAAVYPSLAFIKRDITIDGSFEAHKDEIIEYMKERRYELEGSTENGLSFRIKGVAGKLAKMNEDRITVTPTLEGAQMEGLRKDIIRLAMGLESRLNQQQD